MPHSDLSLFSVLWAEKDKVMIQVYEQCPYDECSTLTIKGRTCRVDKRRRVPYTEQTTVLHVTVLDYEGD